MIVLRLENTDEEVRTQKAHIVLGRASDCDVRFEEGTVSSYHAEINFDGEWYELVPRSAKNGVWVLTRGDANELKHGHRLRRGDRFTLGRPGPVVRVDFAFDQRKFEADKQAPTALEQLGGPMLVGLMVLLFGTLLVILLAVVVYLGA